MSAVDTKPLQEAQLVVPITAVPAEAPAAAVEAAEPTTTVEEPAKTEGDAVAAVEEKKEEVVEEPIYSGALGYKAPGLKNAFRFSKKYFWFGEEEAVSAQSLSHYLRGEKADVAHPTVAWSSQTGRGLLYFVKHADEKATPAGVLNLSEVTDLAKDGTVHFVFKLHGHKHTFETQSLKERNGWFVAVEKTIEEAKAAKETIVASESYQEELAKLNKPATLAATAAKEGSAPKKSIDVAPKLAEVEAAPVAEGSAPAAERAGSSSSSSSSDEEKKKKKAAKKSRSASRGKRASIFGGFLGKKEKTEEKADEKAEEKAEENTEGETAVESSAIVAPTAPVIPEIAETKPVEETKVDENAAPVVAPAVEEKKAEEKPKVSKRGSIFGSFVEKLKSPTTEKKESEAFPAPPAKDVETTAVTLKEPETTAVTLKEETPATAVPVIDGTAEAPKVEETKSTATTPAKEKHFSFGKFLGGAKEKVKSPSAEKTPEVAKTEESAAPVAATEPVVAAPVEPVAEVTKEEEKVETPAKAKRGSVFGNLIRHASKAGSKVGGKKDKDASAAPAKVDETEETTDAAKVEQKEAAAATEPVSIGDVVPEAVTVGQAPKSSPQVSTTA